MSVLLCSSGCCYSVNSSNFPVKPPGSQDSSCVPPHPSLIPSLGCTIVFTVPLLSPPAALFPVFTDKVSLSRLLQGYYFSPSSRTQGCLPLRQLLVSAAENVA